MRGDFGLGVIRVFLTRETGLSRISWTACSRAGRVGQRGFWNPIETVGIALSHRARPQAIRCWSVDLLDPKTKLAEDRRKLLRCALAALHIRPPPGLSIDRVLRWRVAGLTIADGVAGPAGKVTDCAIVAVAGLSEVGGAGSVAPVGTLATAGWGGLRSSAATCSNSLSRSR